MRQIGPTTRDENLDRLAGETFDVLIVGGGITGAGCALDAASRGLKTALIDKGDFASGTSSKSSKLIHGGLRYLAQNDFGLTWEAAHERDLLARLAPHLVRPVQFFYPIFRKGRESRFAAIGLTVYDVLSAVRGVPRHRKAGPAEFARLAPTMDPAQAVAAWTYWDASTDDARLVFELIRAAHAFGAVAANYAAVSGFERGPGGDIAAAHVTDVPTGRTIEVRAKTTINATGVWAGEVGALDDPTATIAIRPAKGIHVVVDTARVPIGAACIVPSGARDRRWLFAIPWGGRVMLGTTDTGHSGSLDTPSVDAADVEYVLHGINKWMGTDLTPHDVTAAWAGLRPLRAEAASLRTADLSRRHAITVSPAGLISVTGGKLTTFRRMAKDAVDAACRRLGSRAKSQTHRLRIGLTKPVRDAEADVADLLSQAGADPAGARRLVQAYGNLATEVAVLIAGDAGMARTVADGLEVTAAEVAWAVQREMAVTLDDALSRRTRLALLDRTGGLGGPAPEVAAAVLGWDSARLAAESARYGARLARERGPVAPPSLTATLTAIPAGLPLEPE